MARRRSKALLDRADIARVGRRGRRAGLLGWGYISSFPRTFKYPHKHGSDPFQTAHRFRYQVHTRFSFHTLNLLYAQNESGVSFGPRKGEVHTFFWNSSFGGAGALSL